MIKMTEEQFVKALDMQMESNSSSSTSAPTAKVKGGAGRPKKDATPAAVATIQERFYELFGEKTKDSCDRMLVEWMCHPESSLGEEAKERGYGFLRLCKELLDLMGHNSVMQNATSGRPIFTSFRGWPKATQDTLGQQM